MSTRSFLFNKQYCYSSDPFLCHSKNLEDEQYYLRESQSSPSDISDDIFLFDERYCPSSGPSSPGSTYSSSQSSNLICNSQYEIKQEPSPFLFEEGQHHHFGLTFPSGLPDFGDLHDSLCEIPADFFQGAPTNVPYEDLINLYDVENSDQIFDALPASDLLNIDAEMENGSDLFNEDPVSSIPAPLEVNIQALRPVVKPKTRIGRSKRVSPPTQAPVLSPAASFSGSEMDSVQQWKQNSAGFARMGIEGSSRSSSIISGDASSTKSSKRPKNSDGKRSPTAYADRRRKNNIAVRKSREKKRQEISKFTEEHLKLIRQCEMLKASNEKLVKTLDDVQGALVEDKASAQARAIIVSAKKQLNLP